MTEEKAKERIKDLRNQVRLYRQSLSFYRDQFNEARDIRNVLRSAIDIFTARHPEHAEEIKELIQYSEELNEFMGSPQENDDD